jgi:hypothetical protein
MTEWPLAVTNGDVIGWASDSFPEYIVSLGWRRAYVYFGATSNKMCRPGSNCRVELLLGQFTVIALASTL